MEAVTALGHRCRPLLVPLGTLSPSRLPHSAAMHSSARCPATTASPPLRSTRTPFVTMARGGRGRRPPSSSSPSAPEAEQPSEALARILRTEAAISGVSRKAAAASQQQSTRLWPRAVLEALDSAVASCRWESALEIFELLRKQRWYEPRSQTYARLLMMLSEERLTPTADVYTALVGAYGYSGMLNEALATVDPMKGAADCRPDEYTFSVLINCCCKLRRFDLIPVVLDEMSYLGLGCNVVIHNAIINGYGKAGMLEEMENALSSNGLFNSEVGFLSDPLFSIRRKCHQCIDHSEYQLVINWKQRWRCEALGC